MHNSSLTLNNYWIISVNKQTLFLLSIKATYVAFLYIRKPNWHKPKNTG
jgi:hypothetical protein